jgi:hypothetical protein
VLQTGQPIFALLVEALEDNEQLLMQLHGEKWKVDGEIERVLRNLIRRDYFWGLAEWRQINPWNHATGNLRYLAFSPSFLGSRFLQSLRVQKSRSRNCSKS